MRQNTDSFKLNFPNVTFSEEKCKKIEGVLFQMFVHCPERRQPPADHLTTPKFV